MELPDTYDTRQAKQKASVKWLLSKAFNNKVPENLREPFYRDHENQEFLKPQIVGALANAELYCLALGNIYSDPNYHNLNHGSIIQTLARKGVLNEPSEIQLTETVLIQTNPLRMSAHMTVIESMMVLYAKEVVTGDRVIAAIQRFNHLESVCDVQVPQDHEQGLILWVNNACAALKKRIESESESEEESKGRVPEFEPLKYMNDLCDGVRIASLISFYCPDELPWNHLVITKLPTVSDSVHNLMLVYDFCRHCLPYSVFHMMPEDVTYLKRTMKQNLVVFLADMFNVLEIHPVKCVRYPGIDKPTRVSRPQSSHLTVRKTQSLQSSPSDLIDTNSPQKEPEDFVVHKGRGVPTLSSVLMTDEPLLPARLRPSKEKQNHDTKADERGDGKQAAAGKPSHWDDKKTSYAGRRSRKNSISDDSQLTIENFGGSQEHLNLIERNPDKDLVAHVGRKISQPITYEPIEANVPIRSTYKDSRSNFHIGYDSDSEKQDTEKESSKLTRQLSSDAISLKNILHSKQTNNIINDAVDGELVNKMLSFADISKQNMVGDQHRVQKVYMHEQDENLKPSTSNLVNKLSSKTNNIEKKTTFATLPNTTTWQQQSSNLLQQQVDLNHSEEANAGQNLMTSQLNDIRMKLEEKRKHIENEKKKIELVVSKQRQKVGKAAFLQAINKGKSNVAKSPSGSSESSSAPSSEPRSPGSDTYATKSLRALQEISEDAVSMELKWLMRDNVGYGDSRKTPELEMDLEHYHNSIEKMNSSLHDIQADIQRLANQQNQLKTNEVHPYLSEQQKQHLLNAQKQHVQVLQQHYPVQQQYFNDMQSYMSVGHVPQGTKYSQIPPETKAPVDQAQFYLHEQPQVQRRTWDLPTDVGGPAYQHPELVRSSKLSHTQGFKLHEPLEAQPEPRFQNGDHSLHKIHHTAPGYTLSQQHADHIQNQSAMFSEPSTPHKASPQHRNINVHRQISQLMGDTSDNKTSFVNLAQYSDSYEKSKSSVIHAPIPTPPVHDMEPQNISFIGNSDDSYVQGISKLNISSGSRTYRIPSPTRPHISRNAFQQVPPPEEVTTTELCVPDTISTSNEKGFYISFDNEQPKKPKPPLRIKRGSPKKEKTSAPSSVSDGSTMDNDFSGQMHIDKQDKIARERHKQLVKELEEEKKLKEEAEMEKHKALKLEIEKERSEQLRKEKENATALVIGSEPSHLDPSSVDEMERKKERIMLLSLQRRQQQEEAKEKKEAEAQARREREKQKEEDRLRRKKEQEARRIAILEQHKLKKAIEEAEREGKVIDKSELMGTMKTTTKMRTRGSTGRPRPKTIHVDSGSVEMAEGMLQPSQGKKGSTSNLSVNSYMPSTLRRDYYRGSQDSLADRGNSVDLPDDNRGMSPCRTTNPTIGRRSSYITSREVQDHGQVRDRPKYPTIQTFKGRKSNSLMNLYGSSSDQESMVYRYGDTDSGLGRATPPRRAPSPGMGPMRHLPSPSGPGSLPPGFMNKRRMFDDGSSDISSTPSSMMDYTGPRLYKQPTTKSNRGIMLNAVEYCVFPGVVNKEAKHRVLEEIARSESKHFLILFRDAGCQFRALYSYCPDREEVLKLYGTGPKQVNDKMFDRFFKYNSGGKCFSQVHTKHLTVTIDAFTIHNSLWQGKKVNLPSKKDMALVI